MFKTLLMGFMILTIGTVALYYKWKLAQRQGCLHKYLYYRICSRCGMKERAEKQNGRK